MLAGSLTATTAFADSPRRKTPAELLDRTSLVPCTGEKNRAWVQARQDAILEEVLFRFALSQAGLPAACEAKITATTEEGQFGSVVYHFQDGTTYSAESLPPETSVISLTTKNGFKNETEAVRQLKEATTKSGLHLDWAKPNTKKSGETETQTFWDPDEGTNGRGFLSYKNGTLVSIGFGMAL